MCERASDEGGKGKNMTRCSCVVSRSSRWGERERQ